MKRTNGAIDLSPLRTDARLTVQYPTGTWELAGWWVRAGAFLIDAIIVGVPGYVLFRLLRTSTTERVSVNVVVIVVEIAYGAILIGLHGRTLGMRRLALRAIKVATGNPLTKRAAWIRSIFTFMLLGLLTEILTIYGIVEPAGWSSHHHNITNALTSAQGALWLTFLFPIWDSKNQTLQDKVAGSVVVKVDPLVE